MVNLYTVYSIDPGFFVGLLWNKASRWCDGQIKYKRIRNKNPLSKEEAPYYYLSV